MAQVREESEQKGGLLRKLFYPFHIKIPIEAFAALLVVVIGVHIFRASAPEIRTVVQAPQAEIQQTAPPETPLKEPTRITKDALETKGRADFLATPAREKAFTSLPPAGKLPPTEHEQGPAAPAPSVPGIAIEKNDHAFVKHHGSRPGVCHNSRTPWQRKKSAFSAAGVAQKAYEAIEETGGCSTIKVGPGGKAGHHDPIGSGYGCASCNPGNRANPYTVRRAERTRGNPVMVIYTSLPSCRPKEQLNSCSN